MHALPELRGICKRAAVRIAANPEDRHTLLNMATVLMYVLYQLDHAAVPDTVGHDLTYQQAAPATALQAMNVALHHVQERRESASPAEIREDLDRALAGAVTVLDYLENP